MKMNVKIFAVMLSVAAALCMSGCSKDNNDSAPSTAGGGSSQGGGNPNAPASIANTKWKNTNDGSYGCITHIDYHTFEFGESSVYYHAEDYYDNASDFSDGEWDYYDSWHDSYTYSGGVIKIVGSNITITVDGDSFNYGGMTFYKE